ncbi:MAG: hypothetical protein Q8P46_00380 [Hyphomicrobiales bacterium]|nr:hypothetical protein [Hyphomicrobiales bacterium]
MRRKPYTAIGIRRVPCARCGKPSRYQWNICADGNRPRGLCPRCDVGLNRVAMRYVFGRTREADLESYALRTIPMVTEPK